MRFLNSIKFWTIILLILAVVFLVFGVIHNPNLTILIATIVSAIIGVSFVFYTNYVFSRRTKKPKINWALIMGMVLLMISLVLIFSTLKAACIGLILLLISLYVIIRSL